MRIIGDGTVCGIAFVSFFFVVVFFAVRRPLTAVASPVAEHRLRTRRLRSHGSWAQPLRGMWDLPRPGHEPVSPALAGGLSTTVPPGKPHHHYFKKVITSNRRTEPVIVANDYWFTQITLLSSPMRTLTLLITD